MTPSAVVATAGNAQVLITWGVSTDAMNYTVKRSTVSGGPYSSIGSPSAPTYTDSAVTNCTKYFYVVSASNTAGASANSAEVNATPSAPTLAAPVNLSATAGNAQVMLA